MMAMLMGLKSIAPRAVHASLQSGEMVVYDVNARQSWLKARVPGAVHLDLDFAPSALPQDTATGLVFYCSNPLCTKAPKAARRARSLGYSNVRVMSAGISGWLDASLPVHSGS